LYLHEWEQAIEHFERLLARDMANPIACMGLTRAYRQLGRNQDCERMQLKSLVLSRIRPALYKVTETDHAASEELARDCELLELDEAAEVFRGHARRIQIVSRK
jgi:hypothetical protein